ncbi:MAG: hypothetical protein H0X19_05935 [Rubrobacter sp.]|jgi:hypothetical protein|nr:hypothetical protein [Rubrobacter sp.]
MTRENGRDGEEPREQSRVLEEERRGAGSDSGSKRLEDDSSASGTEDPAFFIKPSDGE